MEFGDRLRKMRVEHNLSQIELATKIGVSVRTLYNYETSGRIPKIDVITNIAHIFGVTVDSLVSDPEQTSFSYARREAFLQTAKNHYGSRGKKDAEAILESASALLKSSTMNGDAKNRFFQALTTAFLTAKEEARNKYGRKQKG